MLDWIAKRRLDAFEARYDYDVSYLREMWQLDSGAAVAFYRATQALTRPGALPKLAFHAARIVAGRIADCGPCLQLVVQMAEEQRVPTKVIEALLTRKYGELPEDIALVAEFVEAASLRTARADELRNAVRERFGGATVVSLSLVIAVANVYPNVKFALGYGHACSRTRVGEAWVAPAPLEVAAE